jgi:hypothetical protein
MNIPPLRTAQQDLYWLERHILQLKDGGTWLIPRTNTAITIHHGQRKAVFSTHSEPLTETYFAMLGWKVEHND